MEQKIMEMHYAAGEEYGVESTCGNKIDYKSEEKADKSAKKLTIKYERSMEAYPCFFCRGWHIGRMLEQEEIDKFMGE